MTKEKKLKQSKKEDNSKLFVELSLNKSFLSDVKIKLDDPSLNDKKYFTEQINDISSSVNDIEKVKSGDKVITMAQRFSKRLEKIREVNPVNSLDTLRKAGMKELRAGLIKENDKGGRLQFGQSSKDSWTSLLSRFSKIGTVLLYKKDIFQIKQNKKGKLQVFTQEKNINPTITVYVDGKPTTRDNNFPEANELVTVSGDAMERIYQYEIMGNKPKVKDRDKPKGSQSDDDKDSGGATLGTIPENNNFYIFNRFITLAITKDPQKFVEDVTGKDFYNIAGDTKDPLIELLKPNTAKTVLNFIREVIMHGSKQHQSMSNEENKNKINQIIKLTSGVHYDTTKKEFTRLD